MEHKVFLWLASFMLLVILLANTPPRQIFQPNDRGKALLQETTSSPQPNATPTVRSPKAQRMTPTPKPALPVEHNPGLVIGAIIVVAIILFGVFRFTKK